MKNIVAIILYFVCFLAYADEVNDKLLEEFAKHFLNQGVFQSPQIAILNGFKAESVKTFNMDEDFKKGDKSTLHMTVEHQTTPGIKAIMSVTQDLETSVAIQEKGLPLPNISVIDNNGDGKFDHLFYSVYDEKGEEVLSIEDYGMDGVIDFRVYLKERKSEVQYKGKWYTFLPGVDTVEIEGKSKTLQEILKILGRPNS